MGVNLRQRQHTGNKAEAVKRISSRNIEKVNIDSENESDQDIKLESENENTNKNKSKNEIESETIETVSDSRSSNSDLSLVSSSSSSELEETETETEGSEDDREIRRIIKKTEAETRNLSLTARQRAKLTEPDNHITITPIESISSILTDEQSLKKSEKSRRRKLQRDLKLEETKRATIDRLLQKPPKVIAEQVNPETTAQAQERRNKDLMLKPDMIRYTDNSTQSTITFPDNETFEKYIQQFTNSASSRPFDCSKSRKICQVCNSEPKKYTHPTSGQAFCSLNCYKLM